MTQTIKNLPASQETRVQSLDWEDPLEEGMATHSSILAWRIPWTEEPRSLLPTMSKPASGFGRNLGDEVLFSLLNGLVVH